MHGEQEVQEGPPATLPLGLGDAVAAPGGSRCGWEDTQWGWPAATEDSVTVYRTGRQSQGGASEILFLCLRKLNPREGTALPQPLPLKPGLSLPGALECLGRNPPSLWEAPLRGPGWDPRAWQGLTSSPDPWLCIGQNPHPRHCHRPLILGSLMLSGSLTGPLAPVAQPGGGWILALVTL